MIDDYASHNSDIKKALNALERLGDAILYLERSK